MFSEATTTVLEIFTNSTGKGLCWSLFFSLKWWNYIKTFVSRVFQIAVRGGGWGVIPRIGNFTGGDFLLGQRNPRRSVFWWYKPFSKLKTPFCEYWTSIEIKINLTCVCKKYEIKTKMEQEQWLQLKILFLLGYNLEIVV